jgi:hypothetical protein
MKELTKSSFLGREIGTVYNVHNPRAISEYAVCRDIAGKVTLFVTIILTNTFPHFEQLPFAGQRRTGPIILVSSDAADQPIDFRAMTKSDVYHRIRLVFQESTLVFPSNYSISYDPPKVRTAIALYASRLLFRDSETPIGLTYIRSVYRLTAFGRKS